MAIFDARCNLLIWNELKARMRGGPGRIGVRCGTPSELLRDGLIGTEVVSNQNSTDVPAK